MPDARGKPAVSDSGNRPVRVIGLAAALATVGILPVFLFTGLAVQIRAELSFGETLLGAGVSSFFVTSMAASVPCGRLVQRIGTARGALLCSLCSAVAMAGIGVARSWTLAVPFLVVGGVGLAGAHPTANLVLASRIPPSMQGMAFAVKQSAFPIATFVAGLAVPFIALTVGWRWVFVLGTLAASLLALSFRRFGGNPRSRPSAPAPPPGAGRVLIGMAVSAALATTAGNCLGAFLVNAAVDVGFAPGSAGVLFAGASLVGIAVRLLLGWQVDRRQLAPLQLTAGLIALGGAAFGLLAVADGPPLFAVGAVLGFAGGWGWHGLLNYAVVRRYADHAARATGITQIGVNAGGVAGPAAFGLIVARSSYAAAWWSGAGLMVIATLCFLALHSRLDAATPRGPDRSGASGGRL